MNRNAAGDFVDCEGCGDCESCIAEEVMWAEEGCAGCRLGCEKCMPPVACPVLCTCNDCTGAGL